MAEDISLKVDKLQALEVYNKFCEEFSNYVFSGARKSWQNEIVEIFEKLGRRAGFETKPEFLRLDLIWYLDLPRESILELAFEHENTEKLDPWVVEAIDKLRHVKAYNKLLVYYSEEKDMEKDLSRIADFSTLDTIDLVARTSPSWS